MLLCNIPMSKFDLIIDPPVMNAAGFLGFKPDRRIGFDLSIFGAFVTNPVSLKRRTPSIGKRIYQYPGGVLIHTGLPNPGINKVLSKNVPAWNRSSIPIIIHLLVENKGEIKSIISRLEPYPCIAGIELGLSNDVSYAMLDEIFSHAFELPLILRIPPHRIPLILEKYSEKIQTECYSICIGPTRGALSLSDHSVIQGRLYGPAQFPITLATTQYLVTSGFNVIASGGIYTRAQVDTLLEIGALAVQLDTTLWSGNWAQSPY